MIALDCTFRDGGYYNNWEWDLDICLVNDYIKTLEEVGIDAIEVGFRSDPNKNIGTFGKITDGFIRESVYIPDITYFGVMINNSDMTPKLIRKIFSYEDDAPINLVRVATHFKDIDYSEAILKEVKSLGYVTTINLMQSAGKSFSEIRDAAVKISGWGAVDVVYFADSLGGMNHDDVNYAYNAIREGWDGPTGFHGHNNKGQALDNSMEAIDIGIDWVDGTALGVGRGPGNTEIEYLLTELNKRNYEFEVEDLYRIILTKFSVLKEKYGWGSSLLYYLSAEYDIHPTFLQKLISNNYPMEVIFDVVMVLKTKNSSFFNKDMLNAALEEVEYG